MGNDKNITIEVFAAANIMDYADCLEYNSLITALGTLVGIYEENHLGAGKGEIDTEEFNHALCSIIKYCNSVETFKQEVQYALKDKDLTPYYGK